VSERVV